MSQATLLGLCSDNVITILHPSSTIECICNNGVYQFDISGDIVPSRQKIDISGAAFVSGTVTTDDGPLSVTVGSNIFSSTSSTVHFQTFATGQSIYLDISGNGTITGTYSIYKG